MSVIATLGSTPAALAAKAASSTIPIVFATGADPVAIGLVKTIDQPGDNATGVNFETIEVQGKAIELLHHYEPGEGRLCE